MKLFACIKALLLGVIFTIGSLNPNIALAQARGGITKEQAFMIDPDFFLLVKGLTIDYHCDSFTETEKNILFGVLLDTAELYEIESKAAVRLILIHVINYSDILFADGNKEVLCKLLRGRI